jgi:hypothetical protein
VYICDIISIYFSENKKYLEKCYKNKNILCSRDPPPKNVPFVRKCKKNGRGREATDDNIIRRTRFSCWLTKAKNTHSEYVIIIAFPR